MGVEGANASPRLAVVDASNVAAALEFIRTLRAQQRPVNLFLFERTVKFHVSNLLSKFGVQRRADLIVLWMQRTSTFPHPPRDLAKSTPARID